MRKGRKPESQLNVNKTNDFKGQTDTKEQYSEEAKAEKKRNIERLLAEIEQQLEAASLSSDKVKELRDILE